MNNETNNVREYNKQAAIMDEYMFSYVMRQPGICEDVVKCLLPDVKVTDVSIPEHPGVIPMRQRELQIKMDYYDTRLEAKLEDGETIVNIEIHVGDKQNLKRQIREYTAHQDWNQMERFRDYENLRTTYMVYICNFDPFGYDQYVYTFEYSCGKADGLLLDDGLHSVFINTTGHKGDINSDTRALLDYFNTPDKVTSDQKTELVKKIDRIMKQAISDPSWNQKHEMYLQFLGKM